MLTLDLATIPFSRYGAYSALSLLPAAPERPAGLYLRNVRGPALGGRPMQEIAQLELLIDGQTQPGAASASATLLCLAAGAAAAEICMPAPALLRVRLRGAGLRLTMPAGVYDSALAYAGGRCQITSFTACEAKYMLSSLAGQVVLDAPWAAERSDHIVIDLLPGADGQGEFAIEEFLAAWRPRGYPGSFEECVQAVARELAGWSAALAPAAPRYAAARELAAYVAWSCVVAPSGCLGRPSVYASKNGMLGIWSWDHCFHMLGLADAHPALAWDQLLALFDHQDADGALPDLVNDRLVSWSFCKPPVHGWALRRLQQRSGLLTAERIQAIYEPLSRWTNWWFALRDSDRDGLPEYHHGNDSGWDNSTVFARRPPIASPDLAAFLVIQMEFLADAARTLGHAADAAQWAARAEQLLHDLVAQFWCGDRFVALGAGDYQPIAAESLQLFLPLVLGERLPAHIRAALVGRLTAPGRYLTAHGLATEPLDSPHYVPDGYWRGPIWAAPTMLLIDGLRACGEAALAADLTHRFCDLVAANGMAENFDAATGQGLRDLHFAWTALIFLALLNDDGVRSA